MNSYFDERHVNELELIGNKKSVEFYKYANVSYDALSSALLVGFSIDEIKDAYDKYYLDKEIEHIVKFDEFLSVGTVLRVKY
jgi:hypothetical protein